ncbi:hypothetical protein C8R47DRAFT_1288233 [Mycena vitilis]|nr:hypothetical protein C8R47DRAFT_1288233 [Mycena vitilis]
MSWINGVPCSSSLSPRSRILKTIDKARNPDPHPFQQVSKREVERKAGKRPRDEEEDESAIADDTAEPAAKRVRLDVSPEKENSSPRRSARKRNTIAGGYAGKDVAEKDDSEYAGSPASSPRIPSSRAISIDSTDDEAAPEPPRLTAAEKGKGSSLLPKKARVHESVPADKESTKKSKGVEKKVSAADKAADPKAPPKKLKAADATNSASKEGSKRAESKPKSKTADVGEEEEEEPKKPRKATNTASKEVIKVNAGARRSGSGRDVKDTEEQEEAEEKEAPRTTTKRGKKGTEDPAVGNNEYFPTLRVAMRLGGPLPEGPMEYHRFYAEGYGYFTAMQRVQHDERRLAFDREVEEKNEHDRAVARELKGEELIVRVKEVELREREIVLQEKQWALREAAK